MNHSPRLPAERRAESHRRSVLRLFCLLVLAACVGSAGPEGAHAQGTTTAGLRGVVRDSAGAPVAGARVVVEHPERGFSTGSVTDARGRYHFAGLRPGADYRVSASFPGLTTVVHAGLELSLGRTTEQDFRLTLDPIALEGVTVEARNDASRFATSRTGAATTVAEEAIQAHPTVERNFLEMAQLSPMVTETDDGGLSISGQNDRYNTIVINGALHQDIFGAYSSGLPGAHARAKAIPMDAIQEFQVQVAPFDVRSSGFTGGLLNAVTRSGTDQWQGSAFAELRDERFFGDMLLDGANIAPDEYRKQVYGASVGGPLREGRVHLFVSGEMERRLEPPPGYSLGVGDPRRTSLAPDSADRMISILGSAYGMDPGVSGRYGLSNPSANLFSRLDWVLDDTHTLMLHQNYVGAERDVSANRAPYGPYELSSTGYRTESRTHGLMAQLESRLSERLFNELTVSVQWTRDRQDPVSTAPQIDVEIDSEIEGTLLRRPLRAGADYHAHRSALEQRVLQLGDALSIVRGDATLVVGAGVDLFDFRYDYLPGSLGYYRFGSLAELEANTPDQYEIRTLLEGSDAEVGLSVAHPSAFVQNEHRFPEGLTLHYGLRAEAPFFLGRPGRNPALEEALGLRTDQLPSGRLLISPRFGVNWQSDLEYSTQVRGGFGVFTGRIPYVWLANAYANSGLRTALLTCDGSAAPALDPSAPAPTTCSNGTTPQQSGNAVAVVFDEDFRYPRELKTSLAVDQQLPLGFVASAEVLLVQTLSQVVVQDLNLVPGVAADDAYAEGFGQRRHYGVPVGPWGYRHRRLVDGYAHVLQMGNETTSGFAHAVTLELERSFGDRLTLGGAYSFNHSDDVQSLTSGDAMLNFAMSPVDYDVNEPSRRPSGFERPWKLMLSGRGSLPRLETQLSLLYVAEAGAAYSYVYLHDVNGDGYPGRGIPYEAGNDLIYVPENTLDAPMGIGSIQFYHQLISQDPCLEAARGSILSRNACRAPTSRRLDLQLSQPVRIGRTTARVTANLLNVLNLLNSEWGQAQDVAPLVPVLGLTTRAAMIKGTSFVDPESQQRIQYVGPVERDPETGQLRAALPYTTVLPESLWQAQIGLRLEF